MAISTYLDYTTFNFQNPIILWHAHRYVPRLQAGQVVAYVTYFQHSMVKVQDNIQHCCTGSDVGLIFRKLTNDVCVHFFQSAGESGLGKSTLVDSLFLTDLYDDTEIPTAKGNSLAIDVMYCFCHIINI